jgi:hypothetical protein
MFLDREVRAIWAVRGGSGASQLLPALDYQLIRRQAKEYVGRLLGYHCTASGDSALCRLGDFSWANRIRFIYGLCRNPVGSRVDAPAI